MKTAMTITGLIVHFLTLIGCPGLEPHAPLPAASARGDVAEVRSLLAAGADPDALDHGMTALMWAARAGSALAVGALVDAGASCDLRDRRGTGWTALIHAIHMGRNEAALALLDRGADPNVLCDGSTTALHFAAAYGNTEMVRALLDAGADPYAEASGGINALWNAAGGGAVFDFSDGPPLGTCFPETAEALLEKAPDLKLPSGLPDTVVRSLSRSDECALLLARLEQR